MRAYRVNPSLRGAFFAHGKLARHDEAKANDEDLRSDSKQITSTARHTCVSMHQRMAGC